MNSDTPENRRQVNGELLFQDSIVSLHLRKEYLTAVKFKTQFIPLIKY